MPVQISRVVANHERVPRSELKREKVKNEIMVFAAKVRPSIRDQRCAAFHMELSTLMSRMTTSKIRKFRNSVQNGEQDSSFPASVIMQREGSAAEHIANFLGGDYVDCMLKIARSRGDIDNVKTGKRYLEWASEHGKGEIKTRALAGIAKVAADEIIRGNGDFLEREMIKKRGSMKVLSRNIGENEAWKIVKEQVREEQATKKVATVVSFFTGACVAASYLIIQNVSEMKEVGTALIAVMGSSAITGLVAGSNFLGTLNMGMLQRKIGKILKAEEQV